MGNVIVAGPGKSGGSLLMQLFTELGIDTGFPKGLSFENNDAGGSYEKRLRGSGIKFPLPYVVKEPQMCSDIDLRIQRLNLDVDHIYIMLRRPGPEACALEFMRRGAPDKAKFEEQINGDDLKRVTAGMQLRECQIVNLVAEMDLPHTLVSYPRYADDLDYAFLKFKFMWDKHGITKARLKEVMDKIVDKKLVKHAYDVQPEWNRARMREAWKFRRNPI